MTRPLSDAYDALRDHLHTRDLSPEARGELRSVLGDALTGAETSEALHALIGGGS